MPTETGADENPRTDPADGSLPAIDCSLTAEAAERRADWVREHLLAHLTGVEEHAEGYEFVFERSPEAYAAVAEVAWKEARCCSWATFEVVLPPAGSEIRWRERSDREGGHELFEQVFERFEEVPRPNEGRIDG